MSRAVPQPHVALLRGVNVGRGNRIAMADLRALVEALGYTNVRTILNSGNVLFDAPSGAAAAAVTAIGAALVAHGIKVRVIVLSIAAVRQILAANPFVAIATDPARLLIAVFAGGAPPAQVVALAGHDWGVDRFANAGQAAFLWCASGILDSPLVKAFNRAAGDTTTARNWTTFQKLAA